MLELLNANGFNGAPLYLRYAVEINYIYLALYLISAIGMYAFIKQARSLFVFLTFSSLVISLFAGASVQSNIDSVFGTVTTLADGAILYMSYLSSVASKFNST